jgi:hypothetical protein
VEIVSIVVRSRSDSAALERTLASLASQRYSSLDVCVVEAGDSRSAVECSLKASRGAYVGVCDAGDVFFPEHAERLAAALERSHEAAAYSEALLEFVEARDGRIASYARVDLEPLSVQPMLAADVFAAGPARTLVRRDALERAGWLGAVPAIAADYELWLRLLARFDFVRVERVTVVHPCELGVRSATASIDTRYVEALRAIDALHPNEAGPRAVPRQPEPKWRFPA